MTSSAKWPGSFSPSQLDALRQLRQHWREVPFALVGASALSCFYDCRWRRTQDLDLVVSLELAGPDASLDPLPSGWAQNPLLEQEWVSPDGVKLDVLPAGPELLSAGVVEWPRSGQRMSLLGFRHVFARCVEVALAPDLDVPVAPPVVLALLKMVAYLDRPHARQRDLQDLAYLLHEYVADDDPRRWAEPVLDAGLRFEDVAAFLLGQDLRTLLDAAERAAVGRFLTKAQDEGDAHATRQHLLRLGPPIWNEEEQRLTALLCAVRRGLEG